MVDVVETPESTDAPPAETRGNVRWPRDLLIGRAIALAATATFLVHRILVISLASAPRILPDEAGSWAVANVLAGRGDRINMLFQPQYPLGAGAVLAPLLWMFDEPLLRYRVALALTGGLVVAAAYLATRCVRLAGRHDQLLSFGVYAAALLLPALALTSAFTWAEALVYLTLFAALGAVGRALTSGAPSWVVLASLVTGAAPAAHGRLSAVAAVWGVVLVGIIAVGPLRSTVRVSRVSAGLGISVIAASYLLTSRIHQAVVDAAWIEPRSATGAIRDQITEWRFYQALVISAAGQLWYLGIATFGLGLLGILWIVRSIGFGQGARRVMLATWALMLGGVFMTSSFFIASGVLRGNFRYSRADYVVYGRYIDAVIGVLAVFGVVLLWELRDRVWPALAALATLAPLALLIERQRGQLGTDVVFGPVIAGVASLPFDRPGLDLPTWTLLGLFGGTIIIVAAGARRPTGLVATLLVFATAGSMAVSDARIQHRSWDYSALYETVGEPESTGEIEVPLETVRIPAYQFTVTGQQYMLSDAGWRFEFVDRPSAEVAAQPSASAEIIVVQHGDVEPPGWELISTFGPVKMLRRP
jgi:hypothetical protein